ncbi:MC140 [Molluscum contagiosum virus subtype 2]|uniref:DNA packaging protein OPG160 n=2 Tax=Molluscum contagiosum virus TaxID=10279 RepID=A0A1S7DLY0_MCV2|nr:MC140 [Molluscum contagiosum virus subtype 2]QHW16528.1 MC140L [Molluscum contagiosum virus]AYO87775.1 MC140 [Molluscum contagiosum virus subtype 2]AYO87945.1 MC140 [Molluscum contagiosum virus subtype 2]AYO88115.1 MC140 [Molluscum contagiosum virus subtype 2]
MDRVQEARFARASLLRAPFRMALVGGSGSGKTLYLLSLFRTLVGAYRHIFLFTPVLNSAYDGYVWPDHIQKVSSHEELEYTLSVAKKKIERYVAGSHGGERFLLILDDLGDMQLRSRTLLGLLNYGRHLNVSLAMLCQTYKHVPVNGRASITHLCCCNVSESDVENMMRSMSIKGSKKLLLQAMAVMRAALKARQVFIIEDSVFCDGEQRICYDAADERVLARELDTSILLRQFSHMKSQLPAIVEAAQ